MIRDVSCGRYLSVEGKLENGTVPVVSEFLAVWHVRTHKFIGLSRISWPNSQLLLDLDCFAYKLGMKIHLWNIIEGYMHQTWKIKLNRSTPKSEKQIKESCSVVQLNDKPHEPVVIKTTVTTVTTVIRGQSLAMEEDCVTVCGEDSRYFERFEGLELEPWTELARSLICLIWNKGLAKQSDATLCGATASLSFNMLDESQYITRLQQGIYQLYNARSGTLAGVSENYLKHFNPSSEEDHLWEFTPTGPGYTIRSVASGLYISFEGKMENESRLVMRDVPAVWMVHTHKVIGLTRIYWPHTKMLFDLSGGTGPVIQMYNLVEGLASQMWKLKLIRSSTTSERRVEETRRVGGLNDEPLLITTTVTTVTKVVRGRPTMVEEDSVMAYGSEEGY